MHESRQRTTTAGLRALAPLALMALIFWSSAQSGGGDFPEWAHVLAHFAEYAALAALWLWALAPAHRRQPPGRPPRPSRSRMRVSDEIHQSFVPGRVSDPLDVLVDAARDRGSRCSLGAYARGRASTRRTQSQSSG